MAGGVKVLRGAHQAGRTWTAWRCLCLLGSLPPSPALCGLHRLGPRQGACEECHRLQESSGIGCSWTVGRIPKNADKCMSLQEAGEAWPAPSSGEISASCHW